MSELRDKLGTSVNGPEDPNVVFDGDAWERVDWRGCEERVRRLRGRIFKAARDGNLAEVRDLQKLMLRSWSNTLVSVRQATQRNKGRRTAGVDAGGGGGAGARHTKLVEALPGPAGVHTEGQ